LLERGVFEELSDKATEAAAATLQRGNGRRVKQRLGSLVLWTRGAVSRHSPSPSRPRGGFEKGLQYFLAALASRPHRDYVYVHEADKEG
jgi:hypothetical protein